MRNTCTHSGTRWEYSSQGPKSRIIYKGYKGLFTKGQETKTGDKTRSGKIKKRSGLLRQLTSLYGAAAAAIIGPSETAAPPKNS
jgi:hypothetical protein